MKTYLNVGCGNKYHHDWTNIDLVSNSSHVIAYNLIKGFPFNENEFDVVYHSQVLEHIPKQNALGFMKECHRVLKKNGIIRVVVPDLENIVDEYKKNLTGVINNPNKQTIANYDWILLEMYDQTVRNYSGGEMADFLQQKEMVNEQYVIDRIGFVGSNIRKVFLSKINDRKDSLSKTNDKIRRNIKILGLIGFSKKSLEFFFYFVKQKIINLFLGEKYKLGDFRLGGTIHMWMYDRYSLSRLLNDAGFSDVKIKNAFESDIQNWNLFELDVKDGLAYDPKSIFIEARKN